MRLVVEYDVIEPPPQPGEVVRLLGFGSASDLWPLPLRQEMVVERYVVRGAVADLDGRMVAV